ncbi:MAG: hypothetical protein ACTHMS_09465, partial [Jatrophihabitans sp.]|uniref:hypothetical protein n=1 Tax=Jatrophihabitans sp. TaxID=1932789 RepID=UPI003F7FC28E
MTFRRSAATVALAGVGIATGFVLTAGSASAATPVPYEPDANSYGTISFYDASGNQITSGTITDSPIAAYAVGSAPGRSGDTGAVLKAAQPDPAKSTALYNVDSLSAATTYPLTTGPASIQTLSQTHPVVTGSSTDLSLNDFINEFPNDPAHDSNTSYQNL